MIRRMDPPGSHVSVCTFPSPQLYDDEEDSGMICPSTLAVTNTLIVLQCTALQCTALYRIDWFPKKANYTLYFEYVHKCHLSCSIQNFKSTALPVQCTRVSYSIYFSQLYSGGLFIISSQSQLLPYHTARGYSSATGIGSHQRQNVRTVRTAPFQKRSFLSSCWID